MSISICICSYYNVYEYEYQHFTDFQYLETALAPYDHPDTYSTDYCFVLLLAFVPVLTVVEVIVFVTVEE